MLNTHKQQIKMLTSVPKTLFKTFK